MGMGRVGPKVREGGNAGLRRRLREGKVKYLGSNKTANTHLECKLLLVHVAHSLKFVNYPYILFYCK